MMGEVDPGVVHAVVLIRVAVVLLHAVVIIRVTVDLYNNRTDQALDLNPLVEQNNLLQVAGLTRNVIGREMVVSIDGALIKVRFMKVRLIILIIPEKEVIIKESQNAVSQNAVNQNAVSHVQNVKAINAANIKHKKIIHSGCEETPLLSILSFRVYFALESHQVRPNVTYHIKTSTVDDKSVPLVLLALVEILKPPIR